MSQDRHAIVRSNVRFYPADQELLADQSYLRNLCNLRIQSA